MSWLKKQAEEDEAIEICIRGIQISIEDLQTMLDSRILSPISTAKVQYHITRLQEIEGELETIAEEEFSNTGGDNNGLA